MLQNAHTYLGSLNGILIARDFKCGKLTVSNEEFIYINFTFIVDPSSLKKSLSCELP